MLLLVIFSVRSRKSYISTWEQLSPLRKQQLQQRAEGRKAYYDLKASHHELNVEDKVWYYSFARPRQNAPHRLSKKFLPHWTGPHEIVDKLSPVAYRIKIRQGRSEPVLRWVHRNQIKRHQGFSRHEKGEKSNPLTQTNNHMFYSTQT